jgi:signal transduction histidine kinase
VLSYTQNKLLFVTLAGTLLVILTLFFIIFYYYRIGVRKSYEEDTAVVLAALEKERQRISRELHDSVAQEIRGVSFSQDQLWNEAQQGNLDESLYRKINSVQSNTLKEIRTICFNLNPPDFDIADMNAAVSELCTEFEKANNIDCNYIIKDTHIFDRLDSSQKLNLFRIIQEALTNAGRHAGAKRTSVTITSNVNKHLIVFITDDGCGFDLNAYDKKSKQNLKETHFGITGMKQRVMLMHGTIEFITAPGEGTEIRIEL